MNELNSVNAVQACRLRRMNRALARALRAPTKDEIRTAKVIAIKAVQQTKER
jgi:hypothetical protein